MIQDVGADWDADAVHPSLTFSLLEAQLEAGHRAGIRAPIYITVGWDELSAAQHPEWLEVTPEGVRGQHSPWRRAGKNCA